MRGVIGCLAGLVVAACVSEPIERDQRTAVLDAAHQIVRAISASDLSLMEGLVDPAATAFGPGMNVPERIDDGVQIGAYFSRLFETARSVGQADLNLKPLNEKVQLYGDVAIVTFQLREVPKAAVASPVSFARRTFVMRRSNGKWMLVHLHGSNFQLTGPPG